jgi:hypothetical protein
MRQFSRVGVPSGPEVRVNADVAGRQYFPSASLLTGGGFQVAWLVGDNGDVRVRRFGLQSGPALSTAGGFAWTDADGDGVLDAGERPAAGVAVDLLDGGGVVAGSTVTSADGSFRFNGLTAGEGYAFRYTRPLGRDLSDRDQGGDDALDSDADPITGRTPVIAPVTAGGVDLSYGLGLTPTVPVVRQPPVVDDGTAQRSRVRSLKLAFDQPMTLGAGALSLARLNLGGSGTDDGSAPTDASSALATPTTPDGGLTWVWTFRSGSPFMQLGTGGAPTGSLVDGIYTMTLDRTKVAAESGVPLTADFSFTFHRLFGDAQGSKNVNNADFISFRSAFGKTSADPAYNPEFDFDGNGTVNNADFIQFRTRFGKAFNY